jgi:hypothetical protein
MTAPRTNDPLTHERLLELLHYDPLTGEWRWLVSNSNRVRAGSIAGSINNGYRYIKIDGHSYRSNRLAVLYMTGEWPPHLVDHENGQHADDRWENLRPATNAQNTQNSRLLDTNTSGFKDVSFDLRRGKWVAQIRCDGEHNWIGYFSTREAAAIAIAEASEQLHGAFAHKQSMLPHRRLLAAKREREFEAWCNRLSQTKGAQECCEQESQNSSPFQVGQTNAPAHQGEEDGAPWQ